MRSFDPRHRLFQNALAVGVIYEQTASVYELKLSGERVVVRRCPLPLRPSLPPVQNWVGVVIEPLLAPSSKLLVPFVASLSHRLTTETLRFACFLVGRVILRINKSNRTNLPVGILLLSTIFSFLFSFRDKGCCRTHPDGGRCWRQSRRTCGRLWTAGGRSVLVRGFGQSYDRVVLPGTAELAIDIALTREAKPHHRRGR